MANNTKVIACDGPARAGKTTLARNFEERLGIPCIATGNIYRAITVLVLEQLAVDDIDVDNKNAILKAIGSYDMSQLSASFSGEVSFQDNVFSGLTAPRISANAWKVSRIPEVRAEIVEPLVMKMVDNCEYPLVFSEGRDEGRIWKDADRLGLAIFLSVDPLVAAIRERSMRIAQNQGSQELREIMSGIMRYDLDNASRGSRPTYVDDELAVYTGKATKEIKQAIARQHQIVVPTSSIDAFSVFQRVVRLAKIANVFEEKNTTLQTSLLELL
jgi:cytidylate kinase